MLIPKPQAFFLTALLLITLLSTFSAAQNRTLPEEDWYGSEKKMLSGHYTGKAVRLKLMIPETRTGLEILDGVPQTRPVSKPPEAAAMPGDELIIRTFRIGLDEIEVILGKKEPEQKKRTLNPFALPKPPRIFLRFSREITSRDLTIDNIDRLMAIVVEEIPGAVSISRNTSAQPAVSEPARQEADAVLQPDEIRDLPALAASIGELTVTGASRGARVYIDGSFSGVAPITVRLRSGVHLLTVMSEGFEPMERKVFVPGAKASLIKAELRRR